MWDTRSVYIKGGGGEGGRVLDSQAEFDYLWTVSSVLVVVVLFFEF